MKKYGVLLVCCLALFAMDLKAELVEGEDYWSTAQSESKSADNYFFSWLGCASCRMVAEGVDLTGFKQLPLIARPNWRPAAKIQLALNMLPVSVEIQQQFFELIEQNQLDVTSLEAMTAALIKFGVTEEALQKLLTSRELFAAVAQAEAIGKQYQIQYVPTVVVNGRYATDANHAGSVANFKSILQQLKTK